MTRHHRIAIAAFLVPLAADLAHAADPPRPRTQPDTRVTDRAGALAEHGVRYLLRTQEKDGSWAAELSPGITCLALKALIQSPEVGARHPAVQRGLRWVLRHERDDGGLYAPESLHANYESAVALSMLAALNDPAHDTRIKRLQALLKNMQWDEGENRTPADPWYGGAGYGRHKRPDINNTVLMLDALRDSGLRADDPAFQRALVFIQRCQMNGETNDQPFASGSDQGGFIYSPANGGESKAGHFTVAGRRELRCFGSVSYGGLRAMLYAGLSGEDPRVQAVADWIRRHWTLDANPNMPKGQEQEGLFFYFHAFGRAMRAWDRHVITDAAGQKHDWRYELVQKLAQMQKKDGRWVNEADRYYEGHPALTTAWAVLALQEATATANHPPDTQPATSATGTQPPAAGTTIPDASHQQDR